MRALVLSLFCLQAWGCTFARSGAPIPDDASHRHLFGGGEKKDPTYTVMPEPISTQNNAFVQYDLLAPNEVITGNNKTLLVNLGEFASATGNTDLCYWAWQALPPPRGGPTWLAPKRGYWDVSDGHNDQDIEWVQAYGEVAVSRLHSRIKKDGPVVGAICGLGSELTTRRCQNGASNASKCIPPITNGTVKWPIAVSMWKVGHPDLADAVTDWRASWSTGHFPNILWVAHTPGTSTAHAWSGAMPHPGEISPKSMPQAPFPASKGVPWGAPKIAKVVQCADIPAKYRYHVDVNYYCDHMPSPTSPVSTVDDAYAAWTNLVGVWPPVKTCEDDQAALDQLLTGPLASFPQLQGLVGKGCSVVFPALQKALPNFGCDTSAFVPTIRNVCCSQCGSNPIPDVPKPAPEPPQPAQAVCSVCRHVYDADKDGGGKPFADLPDTWKCPVCGAPKAAYQQTADGTWVHEHK